MIDVAASHPSTAEVLAQGWCGLAWTPWVPLEQRAIRDTAPRQPGVYRVRRAGAATRRLVYVGQTGRNLRERLQALAKGTQGETCPFNDPHTAAPHLWLLRQHEGAGFEASCAPVAGDGPTLRGTEDMLLWRHRVETGGATEANHGRFYPGYGRPTNRWIGRAAAGSRVPGRPAAPLGAGSTGIDFARHHPVLQGQGGPLEAAWWQRAPLTGRRDWPTGPAVYGVYERDATEPVYLGETGNLPGRVLAHARVPWSLREPWLAWLSLPADTPKPVLRELESDLLGWHFWHAGRPPRAQYSALLRAGPSREKEA
ncbi:hypothetical protein [Teichococcus vastitatis]|uniref:GIY-YIG domain-containing protein n=1 Tax=Teichococcus vastitatis TaxID=2307076 RepID=A0ABS9W928_9PROT|nr:hypothetical protein [Pseudoroseomonas vastitatis]MCI0755741.1 hypothetical protein [Pseudoroseomonas vastitatis]